MKVLIDYIRLLTLKTYYQYVNSAIPTYIEMALPTVNFLFVEINGYAVYIYFVFIRSLYITI